MNKLLTTEPSSSALEGEGYSLNQHNPHHSAQVITAPIKSARCLPSLTGLDCLLASDLTIKEFVVENRGARIPMERRLSLGCNPTP